MNLRNIRLAASVDLSHDLMWTDEFNWSPVVSSVENTLSGGVVVDTAKRLAGRPISLASPRDDMAWHTRATVATLAKWATVPGEQFVLTMDDLVQFNVVFRHNDAPAIEASPVRGHASIDPDDYWHIKLKFMEI